MTSCGHLASPTILNPLSHFFTECFNVWSMWKTFLWLTETLIFIRETLPARSAFVILRGVSVFMILRMYSFGGVCVLRICGVRSEWFLGLPFQVQWLHPLFSESKGLGLIPGKGTRSHMPQLRVHKLQSEDSACFN